MVSTRTTKRGPDSDLDSAAAPTKIARKSMKKSAKVAKQSVLGIKCILLDIGKCIFIGVRDSDIVAPYFDANIQKGRSVLLLL
jgi:hypothetical protein